MGASVRPRRRSSRGPLYRYVLVDRSPSWAIGFKGELGSVLLHAVPTREETAHALAALGLYLPRGQDRFSTAFQGFEIETFDGYLYRLVRMKGRKRE